MSNLVDKAIELQVMTCLDSLLDRANHDEYLQRIGKKEALRFLEENRQYVEIIKLRLQRLGAIEDAEPSEALRELELVENWIRDRELKSSKVIEPSLVIIEQALLKAQEPKQYLKWEDLIFSEEPTYIKATLNSIRVTIKCWKEHMKEWCSVDFNNAPCNNMMFVHHGYEDDTDTQSNLFDALGFVRI